MTGLEMSLWDRGLAAGPCLSFWLDYICIKTDLDIVGVMFVYQLGLAKDINSLALVVFGCMDTGVGRGLPTSHEREDFSKTMNTIPWNPF